MESSLIQTGSRGRRNPLWMKVLAERGNEWTHQFSFFPSRTRWWIIREVPGFFPTRWDTQIRIRERRMPACIVRLQRYLHSLARRFSGPFDQNTMRSAAGEIQVSCRGTLTKKFYHEQTDARHILLLVTVKSDKVEQKIQVEAMFTFMLEVLAPNQTWFLIKETRKIKWDRRWFYLISLIKSCVKYRDM